MAVHYARTLNDLIAALDDGAREITITAAIVCPHDIVLPENVSVKGEGEGASLLFSEGGLGLTRDNSVRSLRLLGTARSRVIYLRAGAEHFGTIRLEDLTRVRYLGSERLQLEDDVLLGLAHPLCNVAHSKFCCRHSISLGCNRCRARSVVRTYMTATRRALRPVLRLRPAARLPRTLRARRRRRTRRPRTPRPLRTAALLRLLRVCARAR